MIPLLLLAGGGGWVAGKSALGRRTRGFFKGPGFDGLARYNGDFNFMMPGSEPGARYAEVGY